MSCPHCKAEVAASDVYCISCGARLPLAEQASAAARQPSTIGGPYQAGETSVPTVTTGAQRRGGRGRVLLLAIVLNLVLLTASAWLVYAALLRNATRSQGLPTLGAPRLVRVSPPPTAVRDAAPEPQAAGPEPAAPTKATPGTAGRVSAHVKKALSGTPAPAGGQSAPASRPSAGAPATPASRPGRSPASSEPVSDAEQARAGLDAESVRMVVQHHLPQLRLCSDRALKQQNKLSGLVEIQFEVDSEGRVRSASVYRNTTGHDGLGKCIATQLRGWRFPRPVGGEVVFIYPFLFSSEE